MLASNNKLGRCFRAFALAAACCLSLSAPASAAQKVVFNPFPSGLGAQLVNKAWRAEPAYKDHIKSLDMVPDYMLGLADLNGDGTAEIFARHSDPDLGFCDPKGVACLMHIYVYANKKTVEIGKFMASEPVIILDSKTKGISDLLIVDSTQTKQTYVWNGKRYQPK